MESALLYIVIALTVVAVILNSIATYIVLNTYFEIKERKIYQILFVWLVPFVGSILAIAINREDYFREKHKKQIGNNSNISHSEAINHAVAADHHGGR